MRLSQATSKSHFKEYRIIKECSDKTFRQNKRQRKDEHKRQRKDGHKNRDRQT